LHLGVRLRTFILSFFLLNTGSHFFFFSCHLTLFFSNSRFLFFFQHLSRPLLPRWEECSPFFRWPFRHPSPLFHLAVNLPQNKPPGRVPFPLPLLFCQRPELSPPPPGVSLPQKSLKNPFPVLSSFRDDRTPSFRNDTWRDHFISLFFFADKQAPLFFPGPSLRTNPLFSVLSSCEPP